MADIEIYKATKLPTLHSELSSLRDRYKLLKAKYDEIQAHDEIDARLPALKQDLEILIETGKRKSEVLKLAQNYAPVAFLLKYTPSSLFGYYCSIQTAKDALKKNDLSLNSIADALMQETAIDFVKNLIFYTIDRLKITMPERRDIFNEDVLFLAREIFSKNKTLTISEVILVLRRIITGEYGELYNKANALVICPCFDSYRNERTSAINAEIEAKSDKMPMASKLAIIRHGISTLPETSNIKMLLRKKSEADEFKIASISKVQREKTALEIEIENEMLTIMQQMQTLSEDDPKREVLELRYLELGDKLI